MEGNRLVTWSSQRLRAYLSANRQTVLSLAVTVVLLGSLVAVATPSAAVETTLTGPDEVDRNDRITTTATVDLTDDERIPLDAFVLTLRPDGVDDEALTVTFAPNGTVLDVSPEDGTVNNGDIRVEQFVESLTITPTDRDARYGYGYRTGVDGDETREFGYGYGYGYADTDTPEFGYTISFDATALDRTSFVGQLSVDTGEETAFASEEFEFEVTHPGNRGGGVGPGDDAGDSDDNDSDDDRRGPPFDRLFDRLSDRFDRDDDSDRSDRSNRFDARWQHGLVDFFDRLLTAVGPGHSVTSAAGLVGGSVR